MNKWLLALVLGGAVANASAAFIDVNLAGWKSRDDYGVPSNTSVNIPLPVGTQIVGAEYIDLEYESFDPSWRSELVLSLNDSLVAPDFWDTLIAGAPDSSGIFGPVSASFANPGLSGSGPFSLSTGDLFVTVYEDYADIAVDPDAVIRTGTLRIHYEAAAVPVPPSLALFGLGLVALYRRR
jgi:uncharacterized protein (TIGR03382 family)